MILLAVIVAAHGIQGAVKLKAFCQDPANINAYGPLRDEAGKEYQLKLVRVISQDSLIVTMDGIHDRNQAENLRGTKLYIDRNQLPTLVEDEFYHSDLIGLIVQDLQGTTVGRVCAVSNHGAGDFLEIMDDAHHLYTVPFTKVAVPIIQLPEGDKDGCVKIDRHFLLDNE
jgi:16S rRNA processing protein RimM